MNPIPKLDRDDLQDLRDIIIRTMKETGASAIVLSDRGGYRIVDANEDSEFQTQNLSSLSASLFSAAEFTNSLLSEEPPKNLLQRGKNVSVLICGYIDSALLTILFHNDVEAGLIKYFIKKPVSMIDEVFEFSRSKYPGQDLDPADLDVVHLESYLHGGSTDES